MDTRALSLFSEWIEATVAKPSREWEWVQRNLSWETAALLFEQEEDGCTTLGEFILRKTCCLAVMSHLIKALGVDPTASINEVVNRCITCGFDVKHWKGFLDYCHPRPLPGDFSSCATNKSPFAWTPLGRAVFLSQIRTVWFFCTYGCRLPLDEEIPSWAWEAQEEVEQRRRRAREAAMAFLGVGRRRQQWRYLAPLFAKEVWCTRYHKGWALPAPTPLPEGNKV